MPGVQSFPKDRYEQWFPAIVAPYELPPETLWGADLAEVMLPPMPSFYARSGASTVIEVSEIEWHIQPFPIGAVDDLMSWWIYIWTRPEVPDWDGSWPSLGGGLTWWMKAGELRGVKDVAGAEGIGVGLENIPTYGRDNLINHRGAGRLWVLDKMYAGFGWEGGQPTITNMGVMLRVWYRYKTIPLHEYIGIVQQFQYSTV